MKKFITLLGISLLLGCLFAVKTQASINPNIDWDYWYTGTPTAGGNSWDWKPIVNKLFPGRDNPPSWEGDYYALYVPNVRKDNWTKILCVELNYGPNGLPLIPDLGVKAGDPPPNQYNIKFIGARVDNINNDITYQWEIFPQPDWERILFPVIGPFPGPTPGNDWRIGLVSIDIATKCVPEPSTVFAGLSALGLLGLFGWKNRK